MSGPSRRPPVAATTGAALLLLVILSAALWVVRWETSEQRGSSDAFWYTRSAYLFAGRSPDEAARAGADVMAAIRGQVSADSHLTAPDTVDPRYQGIFTARPLYPALAAVFVPLLGTGAMVAAALLGGILLGVVLGAAVSRLTGSWRLGIVATVLVFALPSGSFVAYLGPEGWMLALWTAALAVATLHLGAPRPWRLALLGGLAILLAVTKSSNAGALAAALGAAVVFGGRFGLRDRRPMAQAAAVVGLVLGAQVAVNGALGLPGLAEAAQDVLTDHFTRPNVDSPLLELAAFSVRQVPRWLVRLPGAPVEIALVLAAGYGLLRARQEMSLVWLAGALATALVIVVHPVTSEIPRLLAPIWVTAALGLAHALRSLAGARAGGWLRPIPT